MSKKSLSKEQLQRREFLTGVAVTASAAAVVGAAGSVQAAEEPLEEKQSGRYRKSDHVKAYYDTARI
ncbi:twin-arginine translocation pathway signal [Aestuariirhabdus sp. Z084]|uniref:twin-arginine translocation pathway signal n=1 Tax=Aestuariirhabdus haliotis TaxID=2918751 RepID=UPI00201B4195|nr:twin-arginine translocation pathway signal [Aestuariirhabdus haliotis]MCL6416254.1 twin-arginine translocation pathway signal [Aestuariirhabdus haliotis]MCL6420286.1 twin-arginine translocation pathway signal [Aestuariirhabdus haliotis]